LVNDLKRTRKIIGEDQVFVVLNKEVHFLGEQATATLKSQIVAKPVVSLSTI